VEVRNETGTYILFETALLTAPVLKNGILRVAPNPFNAATSIAYRLPAAGPVTIDVFDLAGRHVRRLVEGPQPEGVHSADWGGVDDSGRRVTSGVYFCRLVSGKFVWTTQVTLTR
jgi:hypothetical protein